MTYRKPMMTPDRAAKRLKDMPKAADDLLIWLGEKDHQLVGYDFLSLGGGTHHGEFVDAHSVVIRQRDALGASIEKTVTVQDCRTLGGLTEDFRLTDAGQSVRREALRRKAAGPARVLKVETCHEAGCDRTGCFGMGPPGWTKQTWWCEAHRELGEHRFRAVFDPTTSDQPSLLTG